MGYTHGTSWNEKLIKEKILESMEKLNIDEMPTGNQLRKATNSNALTNAVRRRGGIIKWAEKLGLRYPECESQLGEKGELIIKNKLEDMGYRVIKTKHKHPYDLLVNESIKIDVKTSHLYKGSQGNFYCCNLEKNCPTCDLYIVICLNEDQTVNKILIIPSKFVNQSQISIGEISSKYNRYLYRWDYINQYNLFYKSVV